MKRQVSAPNETGRLFIFAANIAGRNFSLNPLWLHLRRERLPHMRIITPKRNTRYLHLSSMKRIFQIRSPVTRMALLQK